MSYDILIFEPDAVTDEDFPQWWEQVSRWEEPRDYDTTEGSTPAIRAFYRDLIRAFPPFNGPDALSDAELEEREEQGLPVATTPSARTISTSVSAGRMRTRWSRSSARWPGRSGSRSPTSARTARSSGRSGGRDGGTTPDLS